jgi:hypothetical protein
MTERDIEKNPYSPDEARVAKFIFDMGAGGGDDPIGFIMASHAALAAERNLLREKLREARGALRLCRNALKEEIGHITESLDAIT